MTAIRKNFKEVTELPISLTRPRFCLDSSQLAWKMRFDNKTLDKASGILIIKGKKLFRDKSCNRKAKGGAAMDVQELLTYVEELVFKTSMFGYDKDEVDIQLDKICDEVEAIVKEKDKQIEELKGGKTFVVPDLSELADQAEAEADEEKAALKQQLVALKEKLDEAEKRADEAEKLAAEAEERAIEAEKKAAAAEGKAAVAETKAAAQAERKPVTTDEAYEQYIRNADLLCKQLSDLQTKEATIVEAAQAKAEKLLEEAQVQANEIIAGAKTEAEQVKAEAETKVKEAEAESDKIRGDIQNKLAEEQKQCDEVAAQKQKLVASLNGITAELQEFIKKVER